MMTQEKMPDQNTPEHEDDRIETTGHLFDRWAFLGVKTTELSVSEVHKALLDAHKEIHQDEGQETTSDE